MRVARPGRGAFILAFVAIGVTLLSGCSSATMGLDLSEADSQLKVGSQAARMGLWREARFRYQRAVEIDPTDAKAYNNLGVAYESTGEFEKAREAYLQALKLDRSDTYIQRNYSRFSEFYQKHGSAKTNKLDAGEEKEQP